MRKAWLLTWSTALVSVVALARAQEVSLRIEVLEPAARIGERADGVKTVTIPILEGTDPVLVRAVVYIDSARRSCIDGPQACNGGETARGDDPGIYGCSDGVDNDGDGLLDGGDPDCSGVISWQYIVETGPTFHLTRATTRGTLADLETRGGLRDPSGSFEHTVVFFPPQFQGLGSQVVLSFHPLVVLPPVGEALVCRFEGFLDAPGPEPGATTEPALFHFTDPPQGGGASIELYGFRTFVCFSGFECPFLESGELGVRDLLVTVQRVGFEFLRGDANDDATVDISDPIGTLDLLYRRNAPFSCRDAADANDDGRLDISDPVYSLTFLFLQGPETPAPGPRACGQDPTSDALDCHALNVCF
jgi:hypothetical protein